MQGDAADQAVIQAYRDARQLARPAELFHPRHSLLRSMYGDVPDRWPAAALSSDEWLTIMEPAGLAALITPEVLRRVIADTQATLAGNCNVNEVVGGEMYQLLEIVFRGDRAGAPVVPQVTRTVNAAGQFVNAVNAPRALITSHPEIVGLLAEARIVPVYPIHYHGKEFVPIVRSREELHNLSAEVRLRGPIAWVVGSQGFTIWPLACFR